ncbi:IPT/TIG domain-containing protein [Propionicimonas paludicola]|uniref:IPT/TIG domain-containing protein n=1 Tax=Propionicimonas paludicola TaxID=185243 RepID=A0A2A9CQ58_9ACTN|nr:IPT/TIG domain-containing protein [Propionicimonas paludicola]PFG16276.1 IPT/TIG domain-containing protein [Propionicimonas paludicola]
MSTMIDTSGHDVSKVGIPVSGMTAMGPRTAPIPTKTQLSDPNFVYPNAYVRLGLRKTDGSPDWNEAPGGMIELYEEGNKVSARNGKLTVTQIFAQEDDVLRAQIRGIPVVNGVQDVDIDQRVTCILITEDLYLMPDGSYELDRKVGPGATVVSVTKGKSPRGEVTGTTVQWEIERSADIENAHFRHARIPVDVSPLPVILNVTPAGQKVADEIVIEGYNFAGATAVSIGGTAVVTKLVASSTTIVAKIPAGVAAGDKDVLVTTPNGVSAAFSYTVAA